MLKKLTALMLTFVLLAELCPPPAHAQPIPAISVPSVSGQIIEKPAIVSGKQLILIQDAHDSIEAQKNIAAMIRQLVLKQGVRRVYEEGYEGAVPVDQFFNGLSPDAKKRAAEFALQKMDMGGAEYARVFSRFELNGADSMSMYRQNILAYAKAVAVREKIKSQTSDWTGLLKKALSRTASKSGQAWLKLKRDQLSGKISISDYWLRLFDYAESSHMAGLAQDPVLKALAGKGNEEALKQASPDSLMRRQLGWENAIEAVVLDAKSRQFWAAEKWIDLADRLSRLELSQEDYLLFQMLAKDIHPEQWMDRLFETLDETMAASTSWLKQLDFAREFYETALARDVLFENYLRQNPPKENISVVVYGGFHTEGIRRAAAKLGYGFWVVQPRVTQISENERRQYRGLMSRGLKQQPVFTATAASGMARPESRFAQAMFDQTAAKQWRSELLSFGGGGIASAGEAVPTTKTARSEIRDASWLSDLSAVDWNIVEGRASKVGQLVRFLLAESGVAPDDFLENVKGWVRHPIQILDGQTLETVFKYYERKRDNLGVHVSAAELMLEEAGFNFRNQEDVKERIQVGEDVLPSERVQFEKAISSLDFHEWLRFFYDDQTGLYLLMRPLMPSSEGADGKPVPFSDRALLAQVSERFWDLEGKEPRQKWSREGIMRFAQQMDIYFQALEGNPNADIDRIREIFMSRITQLMYHELNSTPKGKNAFIVMREWLASRRDRLRNANTEKVFLHFRKYLGELAKFEVKITEKIQSKQVAKLMPHQIEGIYFGFTRGRCIFGDEMGLGKTMQSVIASRMMGSKCTIVVAPNSLLQNWEHEVKKWLGKETKVQVINAKKGVDRSLQIEKAKKDGAEFVVINYEALRDPEIVRELNGLKPDLKIVDEAHRLRNLKPDERDSPQDAWAVQQIKPRLGLLLSGSPVINRPSDLWGLFHELDPKAFPSDQYQEFERIYSSPEGLIELNRIIRDRYMIRRTAAQVMTDLPEKQPVEYVDVEMNEAQHDAYERALLGYASADNSFIASSARYHYLRQAALDLNFATYSRRKRESEERVKQLRKSIKRNMKSDEPEAAAKVKELEQELSVANHESKEQVKSAFREFLAAPPSPKLQKAMELSKNNYEKNEATVIFTTYVAMAEKMNKLLADKYGAESVGLITGEVSSDDRDEIVGRFQKQKSKMKFLVVTIQTGGEGFTLTHANHALFLDLPPTQAAFDQAVGRLLRIGQDKPVSTHVLMSPGTVDENMLRILSRKKSLFDWVMNSRVQHDEEQTWVVLDKQLRELSGRAMVRELLSKPYERSRAGDMKSAQHFWDLMADDYSKEVENLAAYPIAQALFAKMIDMHKAGDIDLHALRRWLIAPAGPSTDFRALLSMERMMVEVGVLVRGLDIHEVDFSLLMLEAGRRALQKLGALSHQQLMDLTEDVFPRQQFDFVVSSELWGFSDKPNKKGISQLLWALAQLIGSAKKDGIILLWAHNSALEPAALDFLEKHMGVEVISDASGRLKLANVPAALQRTVQKASFVFLRRKEALPFSEEDLKRMPANGFHFTPIHRPVSTVTQALQIDREDSNPLSAIDSPQDLAKWLHDAKMATQKAEKVTNRFSTERDLRAMALHKEMVQLLSGNPDERLFQQFEQLLIAFLGFYPERRFVSGLTEILRVKKASREWKDYSAYLDMLMSRFDRYERMNVKRRTQKKKKQKSGTVAMAKGGDSSPVVKSDDFPVLSRSVPKSLMLSRFMKQGFRFAYLPHEIIVAGGGFRFEPENQRFLISGELARAMNQAENRGDQEEIRLWVQLLEFFALHHIQHLNGFNALVGSERLPWIAYERLRHNKTNLKILEKLDPETAVMFVVMAQYEMGRTKLKAADQEIASVENWIAAPEKPVSQPVENVPAQPVLPKEDEKPAVNQPENADILSTSDINFDAEKSYTRIEDATVLPTFENLQSDPNAVHKLEGLGLPLSWQDYVSDHGTRIQPTLIKLIRMMISLMHSSKTHRLVRSAIFNRLTRLFPDKNWISYLRSGESLTPDELMHMVRDEITLGFQHKLIKKIASDPARREKLVKHGVRDGDLLSDGDQIAFKPRDKARTLALAEALIPEMQQHKESDARRRGMEELWITSFIDMYPIFEIWKEWGEFEIKNYAADENENKGDQRKVKEIWFKAKSGLAVKVAVCNVDLNVDSLDNRVEPFWNVVVMAIPKPFWEMMARNPMVFLEDFVYSIQFSAVASSERKQLSKAMSSPDNANRKQRSIADYLRNQTNLHNETFGKYAFSIQTNVGNNRAFIAWGGYEGWKFPMVRLTANPINQYGDFRRETEGFLVFDPAARLGNASFESEGADASTAEQNVPSQNELPPLESFRPKEIKPGELRIEPRDFLWRVGYEIEDTENRAIFVHAAKDLDAVFFAESLADYARWINRLLVDPDVDGRVRVGLYNLLSVLFPAVNWRKAIRDKTILSKEELIHQVHDEIEIEKFRLRARGLHGSPDLQWWNLLGAEDRSIPGEDFRGFSARRLVILLKEKPEWTDTIWQSEMLKRYLLQDLFRAFPYLLSWAKRGDFQFSLEKGVISASYETSDGKVIKLARIGRIYSLADLEGQWSLEQYHFFPDFFVEKLKKDKALLSQFLDSWEYFSFDSQKNIFRNISYLRPGNSKDDYVDASVARVLEVRGQGGSNQDVRVSLEGPNKGWFVTHRGGEDETRVASRDAIPTVRPTPAQGLQPWTLDCYAVLTPPSAHASEFSDAYFKNNFERWNTSSKTIDPPDDLRGGVNLERFVKYRTKTQKRISQRPSIFDFNPDEILPVLLKYSVWAVDVMHAAHRRDQNHPIVIEKKSMQALIQKADNARRHMEDLFPEINWRDEVLDFSKLDSITLLQLLIREWRIEALLRKVMNENSDDAFEKLVHSPRDFDTDRGVSARWVSEMLWLKKPKSIDVENDIQFKKDMVAHLLKAMDGMYDMWSEWGGFEVRVGTSDKSDKALDVQIWFRLSEGPAILVARLGRNTSISDHAGRWFSGSVFVPAQFAEMLAADSKLFKKWKQLIGYYDGRLHFEPGYLTTHSSDWHEKSRLEHIRETVDWSDAINNQGHDHPEINNECWLKGSKVGSWAKLFMFSWKKGVLLAPVKPVGRDDVFAVMGVGTEEYFSTSQKIAAKQPAVSVGADEQQFDAWIEAAHQVQIPVNQGDSNAFWYAGRRTGLPVDRETGREALYALPKEKLLPVLLAYTGWGIKELQSIRTKGVFDYPSAQSTSPTAFDLTLCRFLTDLLPEIDWGSPAINFQKWDEKALVLALNREWEIESLKRSLFESNQLSLSAEELFRQPRSFDHDNKVSVRWVAEVLSLKKQKEYNFLDDEDIKAAALEHFESQTHDFLGVWKKWGHFEVRTGVAGSRDFTKRDYMQLEIWFALNSGPSFFVGFMGEMRSGDEPMARWLGRSVFVPAPYAEMLENNQALSDSWMNFSRINNSNAYSFVVEGSHQLEERTSKRRRVIAEQINFGEHASIDPEFVVKESSLWLMGREHEKWAKLYPLPLRRRNNNFQYYPVVGVAYPAYFDQSPSAATDDPAEIQQWIEASRQITVPAEKGEGNVFRFLKGRTARFFHYEGRGKDVYGQSQEELMPALLAYVVWCVAALKAIQQNDSPFPFFALYKNFRPGKEKIFMFAKSLSTVLPEINWSDPELDFTKMDEIFLAKAIDREWRIERLAQKIKNQAQERSVFDLIREPRDFDLDTPLSKRWILEVLGVKQPESFDLSMDHELQAYALSLFQSQTQDFMGDWTKWGSFEVRTGQGSNYYRNPLNKRLARIEIWFRLNSGISFLVARLDSNHIASQWEGTTIFVPEPYAVLLEQNETLRKKWVGFINSVYAHISAFSIKPHGAEHVQTARVKERGEVLKASVQIPSISDEVRSFELRHGEHWIVGEKSGAWGLMHSLMVKQRRGKPEFLPVVGIEAPAYFETSRANPQVAASWKWREAIRAVLEPVGLMELAVPLLEHGHFFLSGIAIPFWNRKLMNKLLHHDENVSGHFQEVWKEIHEKLFKLYKNPPREFVDEARYAVRAFYMALFPHWLPEIWDGSFFSLRKKRIYSLFSEVERLDSYINYRINSLRMEMLKGDRQNLTLQSFFKDFMWFDEMGSVPLSILVVAVDRIIHADFPNLKIDEQLSARLIQDFMVDFSGWIQDWKEFGQAEAVFSGAGKDRRTVIRDKVSGKILAKLGGGGSFGSLPATWLPTGDFNKQFDEAALAEIAHENEIDFPGHFQPTNLGWRGLALSPSGKNELKHGLWKETPVEGTLDLNSPLTQSETDDLRALFNAFKNKDLSALWDDHSMPSETDLKVMTRVARWAKQRGWEMGSPHSFLQLQQLLFNESRPEDWRDLLLPLIRTLYGDKAKSWEEQFVFELFAQLVFKNPGTGKFFIQTHTDLIMHFIFRILQDPQALEKIAEEWGKIVSQRKTQKDLKTRVFQFVNGEEDWNENRPFHKLILEHFFNQTQTWSKSWLGMGHFTLSHHFQHGDGDPKGQIQVWFEMADGVRFLVASLDAREMLWRAETPFWAEPESMNHEERAKLRKAFGLFFQKTKSADAEIRMLWISIAQTSHSVVGRFSDMLRNVLALPTYQGAGELQYLLSRGTVGGLDARLKPEGASGELAFRLAHYDADNFAGPDQPFLIFNPDAVSRIPIELWRQELIKPAPVITPSRSLNVYIALDSEAGPEAALLKPQILKLFRHDFFEEVMKWDRGAQLILARQMIGMIRSPDVAWEIRFAVRRAFFALAPALGESVVAIVEHQPSIDSITAQVPEVWAREHKIDLLSREELSGKKSFSEVQEVLNEKGILEGSQKPATDTLAILYAKGRGYESLDFEDRKEFEAQLAGELIAQVRHDESFELDSHEQPLEIKTSGLYFDWNEQNLTIWTGTEPKWILGAQFDQGHLRGRWVYFDGKNGHSQDYWERVISRAGYYEFENPVDALMGPLLGFSYIERADYHSPLSSEYGYNISSSLRYLISSDPQRVNRLWGIFYKPLIDLYLNPGVSNRAWLWKENKEDVSATKHDLPEEIRYSVQLTLLSVFPFDRDRILDGTFFNDSEEVIKEKIRAMAQFQAALREKSPHVFERLMNKEWDLTQLDALQPNLARAQAFGLSWMVDERLWPLSDTDLEDHFNSKEVSAFQHWLTADFMLYYGSWLEGDWHKWAKTKLRVVASTNQNFFRQLELLDDEAELLAQMGTGYAMGELKGSWYPSHKFNAIFPDRRQREVSDALSKLMSKGTFFPAQAELSSERVFVNVNEVSRNHAEATHRQLRSVPLVHENALRSNLDLEHAVTDNEMMEVGLFLTRSGIDKPFGSASLDVVYKQRVLSDPALIRFVRFLTVKGWTFDDKSDQDVADRIRHLVMENPAVTDWQDIINPMLQVILDPGKQTVVATSVAQGFFAALAPQVKEKIISEEWNWGAHEILQELLWPSPMPVVKEESPVTPASVKAVRGELRGRSELRGNLSKSTRYLVMNVSELNNPVVARETVALVSKNKRSEVKWVIEGGIPAGGLYRYLSKHGVLFVSQWVPPRKGERVSLRVGSSLHSLERDGGGFLYQDAGDLSAAADWLLGRRGAEFSVERGFIRATLALRELYRDVLEETLVRISA